jgi:hypothetical protein
MKSIELLALGLRLLGFYTLVMAARTAAFFIQISLSPNQWQLHENLHGFIGAGAAITAAIFCAGILLIKFPINTAKWILPKSDDSDPVLSGSAKDIQTAAFCILGVYILSWALPALLTNLVIWNTQIKSSIPPFESQYFFFTAITVLQILLGLYLMLQAHGLSNLLWRLRGYKLS